MRKASRKKLVIVAATAMFVAVIAGANGAASSGAVSAADQAAQNGPGQQKKYKATRPIVKDKDTGELRLPTAEELQQTVDSLASLTHRDLSAATATPTAAPGWSALGVNASAGVIVARPNEDGTVETLCVFTFEEAAAFLGLVEEIK